MREVLEAQPNLHIKQAEVVDLEVAGEAGGIRSNQAKSAEHARARE